MDGLDPLTGDSTALVFCFTFRVVGAVCTVYRIIASYKNSQFQYETFLHQHAGGGASNNVLFGAKREEIKIFV